MANLDYKFVEGLINFGRKFAGDIVGQPFNVYRLNAQSNDVVVDPINLIQPVNAKVTHLTSKTQVENDILHANTFEFLMSSDGIQTEDLFSQNDDTYGGNAMYFVSSFRPLKKVLCVRVEQLGNVSRRQSNVTSGYSGPTRASDLAFYLQNGAFNVATGTEAIPIVPTPIPIGIMNVGQIKNEKPTHLPMDVVNSWWYITMPLYPGLEIIDVTINATEPVVRYRVVTPYISPVGLRGVFLLCQRLTP